MARREKCEKKREALLNATLELINNQGFHDAPMSKIAKMAGVSVGTTYVYFENKQDLVNKLYIETKENFSYYAFENYSEEMNIKEGFALVWKNIVQYKLNFKKHGNFLAQCDNSPMIDKESREAGLKHIEPLLKLWERGQEEGVIKKVSLYILYAYSIQPISILIKMSERDGFEMDEKLLNDMYRTVWDAIKEK
ncbi:TetR/AcrR family transcriptional regulator [Aureivirga sp. CE67]|uniref:TetR/AcrR family transcriptional regulator n=1 Tax=Aureivirga sp. CE67 TaxID=1788983 RepID=UPI0018C97A30|nr:TetR/AcrR family transcriptional regulator [Aureivirga sp. CE67]